MAPIKISIITVCYNAAQVIAPTLQSVANQHYPHIEYLIIDGASQDNTREIVAQMVPQAQFISEPDKGIYDAMNKGICRATGDFIWFLNAGDTLRSDDTVCRVVKAIEAQTIQPEFVYGDTMIVDEAGHDLHLRRLRPPKQLNANSFLDGMLICHQSMLVARSIVLPYNLCYRLSSDYDWAIRMIARSKENLFIPEVLSNFQTGGASTRYKLRSLRERFAIMRRHYGTMRTIGAHIRFLFTPVR